MDPEHQVALDFLMTIFRGLPDDQFVQLAYIHPSDKEKRIQVRTMPLADLPSAVEKASFANKLGYGVYFRVCSVSQKLPDNKRGGANVSACIPALWLDIDSLKRGSNPSSDAVRASQFLIPPSAVLLSGNGVHAYWLLQTPVALSDENREVITGLLRGLARQPSLAGDPSVAEVSRLMRVPGFRNTKPEAEKRSVSLVDFHPERRYALAEFARFAQPAEFACFQTIRQPVAPTSTDRNRPAQPGRLPAGPSSLLAKPGSLPARPGGLPATPGSLPAWAEAFVATGDGGRFGGRNNTAYRLACHLFGTGADEASVRDVVGRAARMSGLDEREIEHLLRSAQKRIQRNTHP